MKNQFALAATLLLATLSAQAQEAAQLRRPAELRELPGETSRSIAPLPAQAQVVRSGERQGAWVQVRNAAGQSGWVHMFDLGPAGGTVVASGEGNAATGALRGLTNLFNKGTTARPVTSATSTIGIRGLDAQDIAQAQPNAAAVTQMEGLRQSESQAREFANQSALVSVNVAPLPSPARARPATQNSQGQAQ